MKTKETFLRQLHSVDELLKDSIVQKWLEDAPRALVLDALRMAIEEKRKEIIRTPSVGATPRGCPTSGQA